VIPVLLLIWDPSTRLVVPDEKPVKLWL